MYIPADTDKHLFGSLCPSGALATSEDWVVPAGVCRKQRIPDVGALLQFWALLRAAVWRADFVFSVRVQCDVLRQLV